MVLKGTINNISQPHVHAGSDITSGEIDNSRLPEIPHSLYQNAIINGNFDIWQRGTSFTSTTTPANSDDIYFANRWILLSDGNDIVDIIRPSSSVSLIGSTRICNFEVETANKKFGILQIIESEDSLKFAGKTVSLSFAARTVVDKELKNLRAAVLSWNGTADSVTSDVVSAWNAEGADPTLVSNWTYENTPTNITLTTGYQTFKIEGISIDTSGMTNLAVFIWCDDTDAAVNDVLYIGQIQLCEGDIALPFQPRSFAEELQDCLRYYERIQPTTATALIAFGMVRSTTVAYYNITYVKKRAVPTISCTAATTFSASDSAGNAGTLSGTPSFDIIDIDRARMGVGVTGLTPNYPTQLYRNSTSTTYIEISAEL